MKRINKLIVFCTSHSVILVPVIVLNLLYCIVQMFDVFKGQNMDVSSVFDNIFDSGDKLYGAIAFYGMDMIDYLINSWMYLAYYIVNMCLQSIVMFGMILMAFENGFSTLEDCWHAFKKYAGRFFIGTGFGILMILIAVCGPYIALILLSDSDVMKSVFGTLIVVFGFVAVVLLIYMTSSIWWCYSVFIFMKEKKLLSAVKGFFTETAKCWLPALPMVILLDVVCITIKLICSNIDFLFLLSAFNNSILDSVNFFAKTVWMVLIFYDKNPSVKVTPSAGKYIRSL